MLKQQQKNSYNVLKNVRAAIYCRLSRDDDFNGDSMSIQTQKQMLTQYAKENGFIIVDVYIDDGYSGTNFDRPNFRRMEADIEAGKIDIVMTKDLSRLGRDYLQTGYYTEVFFPKNNIRYIAVNDGVDSENGENEFAPFRNIMNEWYAKDISKKVRSGYHQRALNGDFTASFAPYGYEKSQLDKHKLVPDENVAHIVKRIFDMAVKGYSPYKISMELRADEILTPRAYVAERYERYKKSFNPKYPYDWCNSTITKILQNRVYMGHIVNNKSTTKSFKVKQQIKKSPDEWIEVKNTHEPLVDEDTFELAQRVITVRKRTTVDGENQIFAGLLKCSTCGLSLSYSRQVKAGGKGSFACNKSRKKGKKYCTLHYISYVAIYSIILEDIKRNAEVATNNKKLFVEKLALLDKSKQMKQSAVHRKEYGKLKNRITELQAILKKLYEDNALGRISDEQYTTLSIDFETEKNNSMERFNELERELSKSEEQQVNTSKFIELVRKYTDIKELTKPILNELIEKVIVHDAETIDGKRTQKVDIYYRFVGMVNDE